MRRLSEKWAAGRRTFNICKVSWFFVLTHIFPPFLFHSCASNNKSRKISANTVYTQATGMCLHVCSRRHTHKEKRANASRLTPFSNPCWSQPFLPASLFSSSFSLSPGWGLKGASLLREAGRVGGLYLQSQCSNAGFIARIALLPCLLIHHLTLL